MVVSHSLEQHDDKIKFWHHQLDHMSKKCMLILSKYELLGREVTKGKKRREKFGSCKHTTK